MIDLDWLATTCICNHIRPDWLYYDGYCSRGDVDVIKRIIFNRFTHAPAVSGHAAVEHITVGRKAVNTRVIQLKLEFSV